MKNALVLYPATCLFHILCPACSSQIIINILSRKTRKYLSATHFTCSLALLARLAHSLPATASHHNTAHTTGFTAPFILNTLPSTIHLKHHFFHLCWKVTTDKYQTCGDKFVFKSFKEYFSGMHVYFLHCKDKTDAHHYSRKSENIS